ncbi:MAG: patatin-like phospholipase family protein [Actinobacteria bacterium]|nr:MAG: patatin-like phospholipase family protein [Actinomycetota bacterium]
MAAPGYSFGWPRAGEGGAGPSLDPRLVFVMARSDSPRVGLVLGAGGIMGGAWITGGLEALATETGWDPASADRVVGTSAGSMMGALLVSGVPPWFMVAHSAGRTFQGLAGADGRPAATASRSGGAQFRYAGGLPPIGPGSWRLIANSLRSPGSHRPAALLAGWLPRGPISTEPIKETIRRVVPHGWTDHPSFWAVACDYTDGHRVAFGREDAPEADLADAVAASCAIPGFYEPVTIAGRRYIDGGLWSTSNLDILRNEALDLVICLNPTSSLHPPHAWNPVERLAGLARRGSGRRLGSERKKLVAAGTEVVLIQPTDEDHEAMGPNLMSTRNRNSVIRTAIRTVREQLLAPEVAGFLRDLPPGPDYKIREPDGPPSEWPDTLPGVRRRTAAARGESSRAAEA